jgi:hypothetical protein
MCLCLCAVVCVQGEGKKAGTKESARLPPAAGASVARKASVKGDKKEVGDFFKNLMNKK